MPTHSDGYVSNRVTMLIARHRFQSVTDTAACLNEISNGSIDIWTYHIDKLVDCVEILEFFDTNWIPNTSNNLAAVRYSNAVRELIRAALNLYKSNRPLRVAISQRRDDAQLAAVFLDTKGPLPANWKAVFDRLNDERSALIDRADWSGTQPAGLSVEEITRMKVLGELCDEYVHRMHPDPTSNDLLALLAEKGVEAGPLKEQFAEVDKKAAEYSDIRRQLFEQIRRGESLDSLDSLLGAILHYDT